MNHIARRRRFIREWVFTKIYGGNDDEGVSSLNVSILSEQGLPAPQTRADLDRFIELVGHPNLLPETKSLIEKLKKTYGA